MEYLSLHNSNNKYSTIIFYNIAYLSVIVVGPGPTHVAAVINDIMFQFPSSPPLSQLRDISPDTICNDTHKPDSCGDICSCTHIIELPYNGIIELVIIDESKGFFIIFAYICHLKLHEISYILVCILYYNR